MDNRYIQALEYFSENNIKLSNVELSSLKTKLDTPIQEANIDEVFDTLLETYTLDDTEILEEGAKHANKYIYKVFKNCKEQYKKISNKYKEDIKKNDIKAAKKDLDQLLVVVTKSEEAVRDIDSSGLWNELSGLVMAYTVQIARSLIVTLVGQVGGDLISDKLVEPKVSSAIHDKLVDNSDIDAESLEKLTSSSSKAIGALAASGFSFAVSFINDIDILVQKSNDRARAKEENDLKGYQSASNYYRERVLIVLKDMKKEIVRYQKHLDNIEKSISK